MTSAGAGFMLGLAAGPSGDFFAALASFDPAIPAGQGSGRSERRRRRKVTPEGEPVMSLIEGGLRSGTPPRRRPDRRRRSSRADSAVA